MRVLLSWRRRSEQERLEALMSLLMASIILFVFGMTYVSFA